MSIPTKSTLARQAKEEHNQNFARVYRLYLGDAQLIAPVVGMTPSSVATTAARLRDAGYDCPKRSDIQAWLGRCPQCELMVSLCEADRERLNK